MLQFLQLGSFKSIVFLCQHVEKNRLIAADEVCKVADCLQNKFFKYHIANIVDRTTPSAVFVICTAKKLLIGFQTLCGTKMKLCSAVWAIYQSGKQALSAGSCRSAAMFSQLLYPQPFLLRDNRLLLVGNDLVFPLRMLHSLMHLVAHCCAFEIHRTAGVLAIFQNMRNRRIFPLTVVSRYLCAMVSSDGFIISRRNQYALIFQLPCNLTRASARKAKGIDFSHHLCGGFVDVPYLFILSILHISKGNSGGNTLAMLGFGLPHSTDFL